MKCTELIIQDHAVLRRGLSVFDGMLDRLEMGQRIEIADVVAVAKFLHLFADQYHQTMEESILFPALLRIAPNETGLRELMAEHADERALIVEIEDALVSRKGMPFFRSSRRLTSFLRNHCHREEFILADVAGRWLSAAEDSALVSEILKNRPAEIYANFPRLEQKYLGHLNAATPLHTLAGTPPVAS